MNTNRALHTLALIVVLGGLFVVLPVWGFLAWVERPDGLEFTSSFQNDSVAVGGNIEMHGTVSVPRRCRISVIRRAIDSDGTIVHSSIARFMHSPGEDDSVTLADIHIPPTAALGEARLTRIIEWRCNWLQELLPQAEDLEPLRFTIVPVEQPDSQ